MNIEAEYYLDSLFLSAISTVLLIRFYLHITGYPQIGIGELHIAHTVWGGFIMLFSIIILLTFLSRPSLRVAAIFGGVGFGTFIDELGKFITKDNNYFYSPTFSLIYVIFIVFFLSVKLLEKRKKLSEEEYLDNALEFTRYALFDKTDPSKKEDALKLLEKCDPQNPAVEHIHAMLDDIEYEGEAKQNIFAKIHNRFRSYYKYIIGKNWFTQSIIIFFVIFSLFMLFQNIDIVSPYFWTNQYHLSYIQLGKFFSSIVSTSLVLLGILRIRFSRIGGYKLFKVGILVSLLLTQVFDFYYNQLSALGVFFFNIFILFILNYLIEEEQFVKK
jgi:hypothetical protein